MTKALRSAIMSKQFGNEDFLAKLVADACISILPEKTTFNVDNVRICKILGSGIHKSEVVQVCIVNVTCGNSVFLSILISLFLNKVPYTISFLCLSFGDVCP